MYAILMACISSARMAAIHPILPGGREFTKRFSPSRRHLISMEARPDVCVCCNQGMRPSIPLPKNAQGFNDTFENRNFRQQRDIDLDDENLDDDELDDIGTRNKKVVLTPLPRSLCSQGDTECHHYAHDECMERMVENGDSCPRCEDVKRRLHLVLNDEIVSEKPLVKYPVYCKHIEAVPGSPPGFAVSSKLNQIVEHIRNVIPADDKILVLSFFKASLDLLEGIFEDELKIGCCRFDGDLGPVIGNESLEDFKTNPEKRILLATVQSGGTGLNITQAVRGVHLNWLDACGIFRPHMQFVCTYSSSRIMSCLLIVISTHLHTNKQWIVVSEFHAMDVTSGIVVCVTSNASILFFKPHWSNKGCLR